MELDWRKEGFFSEPKEVILKKYLIVNRVWGGESLEPGSPTSKGVCFLFEEPKSRKEAEGLTSVFEHGNSARYISKFQISPGAKIFVGKVHPGDFYDHNLGAPGSQIYVEQAQVRMHVKQIGVKNKLIDDMNGVFIVAKRDPGKGMSS